MQMGSNEEQNRFVLYYITAGGSKLNTMPSVPRTDFASVLVGDNYLVMGGGY